MPLPGRPPTAPLPGPRTPPDSLDEDLEWREQSMTMAVRHNMLNPDPDVQILVAEWADEAALYQEIRRGRNDCG